MRNLKRTFTRWRNSRGFGVHSPFGFDITRRVVRIGKDYAYYAEKEIDGYGKANGMEYEDILHAIKLHRFAAMMQSKMVLHKSDLSELQRIAFERAGCKTNKFNGLPTTETNGRPYILIGDRQEFTDDIVRRFLIVPNNSVILYSKDPEDTALEIMNLVDSGIVIEGLDCVLAIGRLQTQPNLYKFHF